MVIRRGPAVAGSLIVSETGGRAVLRLGGRVPGSAGSVGTGIGVTAGRWRQGRRVRPVVALWVGLRSAVDVQRLTCYEDWCRQFRHQVGLPGAPVVPAPPGHA